MEITDLFAEHFGDDKNQNCSTKPTACEEIYQREPGGR